MLGAGGAAKAIAFGLQRRGAEVVVASRTRERADRLADALSIKAVDWAGRHNFWADILINCTPVGMHPNVDETPYDKHYLKPVNARLRHGLQSGEHAADQRARRPGVAR